MRPMNPRVKELQTVEVPCAFCGGKGRDAFGVMSWLSTCYVCFGRKDVSVVEPFKECRYCKGTGIEPKNGRVSCIVCKGYGVVHIEESSMECPACKGAAVNQGPGSYCWPCHGKGEVPRG